MNKLKNLQPYFYIVIICISLSSKAQLQYNMDHQKGINNYVDPVGNDLSFLYLQSINNTNDQNSMKLPPSVKKIPEKLEIHGHIRIDNYYWLRERENPEVIKYLNEENEYTQYKLRGTETLQNKIFEEIIGRIKQEDMSVPYMKKGYYYYTRYEEKKEYPVYCRKKGSLESQEEILLNVNEMAEGKDYYDVRGLSMSPDMHYMTFGVDTMGRRLYKIFVKNLLTGEITDAKIENTTGSSTWANDSKTIFYSIKDLQTLRPYKIFRKQIIDQYTSEELVFEEKDETFVTYVYKTKSEKYIIIGSSATLSNEYQFLNADIPQGQFKLFHKRENNLEYSISHINDKFYIRTNLEAENFRIMETPESSTQKESWKEVIPHRSDVLIEDINIFKDFLVISERVNTQQKLRIIDFNRNKDFHIPIDEDAYSIYVSINPEMNSDVLRYAYQSMTTPSSVFDFNMVTGEKTLLKQQEILGGFNADNYVTKRIFVKARDGEEIPLTYVYNKKVDPQKVNPFLLYGYGSYGNTIDPYFSISRISLLDRGFIFAIAHIRGSEIKGRRWYEDGKMLHKKNTFTDFVDCAKCLIENKYTSEDKLYAMGGSAGGLLMGAVLNMSPDLFHGVVAAVPFVDVVTTMLDETIPLTTGEYDEWGNPNIKKYYDYILSYSPYDNVEAKDYPAILVTTGLHDSQVQYWEPAKWVAKLREMKTDDNILLMYTDMESGHSGTTGRFKAYKDTALEYAFILMLEGINE